jgi:hypothetical protein
MYPQREQGCSIIEPRFLTICLPIVDSADSNEKLRCHQVFVQCDLGQASSRNLQCESKLSNSRLTASVIECNSFVIPPAKAFMGIVLTVRATYDDGDGSSS